MSNKKGAAGSKKKQIKEGRIPRLDKVPGHAGDFCTLGATPLQRLRRFACEVPSALLELRLRTELY